MKVWIALILLAGSVFGGELRLLCSTFPIFQLTRNVVGERDSVSVKLLLPAELGCPHDYVMTPRDIRRLTKANALVLNGLGMEAFLTSTVQRVNPELIMIDSGAQVASLTVETPHACASTSCDHDHRPQHHHHRAHKHDREPTGPELNPHAWVSPIRYATAAATIAAELAKLDPAGGATYAANAAAYAKRLDILQAKITTLAKSNMQREVVADAQAFAYLGADLGLSIVAELPHGGDSSSAADMRALLKTTEAHKPAAILTQPSGSRRLQKLLKRDASLPVLEVNLMSTGPIDAPLTHYETVMLKNLDALAHLLQSREP
ncbi:MAG TPA: hypothetical protein DCR55_05810 [Lentisphaeria bacterium]|jgi:ABC-type Zn uptake system ZnuABC Zn-binding protein ZnuA|nr:hypothetical protein [Lentisphaeria bacterium]